MKLRIVAGLIKIATLDNRFGLIQLARKPNIIRSEVVSFGERLCCRDNAMSCWRNAIFSAAIALAPPSLNNFIITRIHPHRHRIAFVIDAILPWLFRIFLAFVMP